MPSMQAVYRRPFAAQANSGVVVECRGRIEVIGIVTLGPPDEDVSIETLQPRFRYRAKPAGFALQFTQRRELDVLKFMEDDQLHAAVINPARAGAGSHPAIRKDCFGSFTYLLIQLITINNNKSCINFLNFRISAMPFKSLTAF
jgi:hypothetical protein